MNGSVGIESEKRKFLEEEMMMLVFAAAFSQGRRYPVYRQDEEVPEIKKTIFKNSVAEKMREHAQKYTREKYLDYLTELQEFISSEGKDILYKHENSPFGWITFGRVQKLLNLYLKYRWILNYVAEQPPHCPIDRNVLTWVKWKGPSWQNPKFTKEEYEEAIAQCRNKANASKQTISEWELAKFNTMREAKRQRYKHLNVKNIMKKLIITITALAFILPSISFASTLTQPQIDAVIGLLRAFSVEQSVIALIQTELGPQIATLTPNNIAPVSSSSSSTSNSMILSLSVNQPIVSADSIRLSWNTNIPANSKVFITPVPVASNASQTQVFQSISGYSTQGFVTIPNLTSSTQYSYTIEAISDAQDQQLTGLITTGIAPIIAPTATITSPDSLTAPITISGTTSLPTGSRIYISVRNTSGYTIASYTTVTNGTWSIPFGTGFPSGSYSITVRSNSSTGTILTTGTLPVTVTKSSKYSGGTMP